MDGATITSLVLGTIGTVTGCYATWLSYMSIRQQLTITRPSNKEARFLVINFSLRPIPVQSIQLELRDDGPFTKSDTAPTLKGISLPGALAPESSFEVDWDLQQYVEIHLRKEYRLTVTTQTGNEFVLQGRIEEDEEPTSGLRLS